MAVLELTNVSKHFGAIHALNDVSLSLEPGQVLGLMGDNGAGKSTLVKIIAGNFPPTHGTMQHRRQARSFFHKPIEARRARRRDRLSGPRAVRQSNRRRQRFPRPRDSAEIRSVPHSRSRCDEQARRRAVQGIEIGNAPARPRQADVGRPAPGGRHRAHHALARRRSFSWTSRRRRFPSARSPRC